MALFRSAAVSSSTSRSAWPVRHGAQRARATIAEAAPGNIVTIPGRENWLAERQGLPLAAMSEQLRNLARELVADFTHSLRHDLAEAELARIKDAGVDKIHFAWAGARTEGIGHYYRVQGPTFLIEFVNTQPDGAGNPANHIHCVYRSMAGDFGEKL
jgi:hypothetical protein